MIKRSGTWFYYEDLKLGQGKENSYQFLEANPEVCKIEKLVREKNNLPVDEAKLQSENAPEEGKRKRNGNLQKSRTGRGIAVKNFCFAFEETIFILLKHKKTGGLDIAIG